MEEDHNGRRPQWKTTLNGRQPQWKTTYMEDGGPQLNRTSMEDDHNGRPQWNLNGKKKFNGG